MGSYWQSDDFIAVTYAQSIERAFRDFTAPQFGLESLVLFFRPMITLSFAFDSLFGNWAPFVSHLGNAVIHGISAMCLALIVARFLPARCAWASGLVWGLAPCHASSVFWAIGRVDSHTTLWIVLATLTLVQWCGNERPTRKLSLLFTVIALCTKELAWVVPGIAAVVCFAMARPGGRWRGALVGSWPYFAILAGYFGWRFFCIGRLVGGYDGAIEPGPALIGLGTRVTELVNPLMHSGSSFAATHVTALSEQIIQTGFVPAAIAVVAILVQRRWALFAVLAALFLGCSIPSLQIWAQTDNPMLLRQFYLPMMPIAVLLSIWGWRSAVPVLVVAALPFLELRDDYVKSWQRCADWHEQIREVVPKSPKDLTFIAGLPRQNEKATTVEFHLWVDRLLQPPFGTGDRRVFALRTLSQDPARFSIPYGEDEGLPFGTTFAGGPKKLAVVHQIPRVRPMGCEWTGPTVLDVKVLDRMVQNFKKSGRTSLDEDPNVVLRGVRSKLLRVTIFTGDGFLTAFVPDTAPPGAKDGRLDIGLLLYASVDGQNHKKVGDLIQNATALDLTTRFPILVEADTRSVFSGKPEDFEATHSNYVPVWLHLFRRFADWWP
jgi:hypothetical protein